MEDKSGVFDALLRRKEKLKSLQSYRQRQINNTRSCSRKSVDVIENSDNEPETPIKRPRKQLETPVKSTRKQPATPAKRPNKQPKTPAKRTRKQSETPAKRPRTQYETPVKCPEKQPETLIKYYIEQPQTPMKATEYQDQVNPNAIDSSIINTSTFSLPVSHDFFTGNTPSNSPFKICINDRLLEMGPETGQAVAASRCTLSASIINIKNAYDPFPKSELKLPGVVTTYIDSLSAADSGLEDTHHMLPGTGSETGEVDLDSICTPSAPFVGTEDTRHQLPETRPATVGVKAASTCSPSAPAVGTEDTRRQLSETRPATAGVEAASTCTQSAPAVGTEDTRRQLPETRPETVSGEVASTCTPSAPAVGTEDSQCQLPETRPETVGGEAASTCTPSTPAVDTEDTRRQLPETRLETVGGEAASTCTPSAPAVGTEDTRHQLPKTRPETVGGEAASTCTPSTPAVDTEDTRRQLPETRLETVGGEAASTCTPSTPAVDTEDTRRQLPETRLETVGGEAASTCTPSAPAVGTEDTRRQLPKTRPETVGGEAASTCSASAAALAVGTEDTHHLLGETEAENTDEEMTNANTSTALSDTETQHARLTKTQKRRKRRKANKVFRKSCLDFQTDEEEQDFSAGSSDVWSCSDDSDTSESSNDKKSNKKKRKNKRSATTDDKIKIKEKKINIKKINKQRKESGKEYTTRKGKVMEAKIMLENPCVAGKCKRGCYKISEDRRRSLFKFYWDLDVQRRRDWLVRCAREVPIKRKRVDTNRRNCSYDYFINDGDDHRKVCQKFLLNTLNITQRQLLYILSSAQEGMSQKEMRKPHCSNKYSESAKTYLRNFIEKLPACPSHYNRKKSKRMYLAQELKNLSNLFRIYLNDCKEHGQESVSESIFRKIFNEEYDLGFHTPKKDKCVLCTKSENIGNEMTEKDKEKLKIHMEEKEATYKRFKAHQTLKDVETVTCSFDLQKVLNTPFGESMLLYYSRKYAVFNFTIYESSTQNVFCFTWGECDGKRGSIEMASCLYLYLKELDKKGVKNALMYCDSCTGQNKNRIVLSVLNFFLYASENLQVIQINYLLPGHTYMPADSVHATIEAEVKKLIVWAPSQWASYFESARKKPKPYNVTVMEHSDFIDWQQLAAKTFTKETSKNIKFKDIRVATFRKKKLNQIEIKYSMKEEAESEKVTLFEKSHKKGKGKGKGKGKKKEEIVSQGQETEYQQDLNDFIMQPMYLEKLPISTPKYRDLQKLCLDVTIPKRFHKEYLEMPYNRNKTDTLNETDEEDCDNRDDEEVTP